MYIYIYILYKYVCVIQQHSRVRILAIELYVMNIFCNQRLLIHRSIVYFEINIKNNNSMDIVIPNHFRQVNIKMNE